MSAHQASAVVAAPRGRRGWAGSITTAERKAFKVTGGVFGLVGAFIGAHNTRMELGTITPRAVLFVLELGVIGVALGYIIAMRVAFGDGLDAGRQVRREKILEEEALVRRRQSWAPATVSLLTAVLPTVDRCRYRMEWVNELHEYRADGGRGWVFYARAASRVGQLAVECWRRRRSRTVAR